MRALVLEKVSTFSINQNPLRLTYLNTPIPERDEILIEISVCGVCHTELDEIEGRLKVAHLPIVLGHQIIGRVIQKGKDVKKFHIGERVGIGWIYSSCGKCIFCRNEKENLCREFKATGKDFNGGYAEYVKIKESFAFAIPEKFSDVQAAPLFCAGAIGYRSLRLCNHLNGQNLGLVGFGSSAHLVIQLSKFLYPQSKIFVFARSAKEREFAKELGAYWTGDIEDEPPQKLYSVIDTTPAWKPVVYALKNLQEGGRVVINAIRKEDFDKEELLKIDYPSHIWLEKEIKSVANVTRQDIKEFLRIAEVLDLRVEVQEYQLEEANKALQELKDRKIRGAKVLVIK
ncbi:MAG: zinc-dependent alcohol dehydrogenase family protein [Thermodesulfovibrionales bacterium]|nr:zinc-dependent alcohol dehydrogenase family protein [Thermodesulfovibrionales bacterium]